MLFFNYRILLVIQQTIADGEALEVNVGATSQDVDRKCRHVNAAVALAGDVEFVLGELRELFEKALNGSVVVDRCLDVVG